MKRLVISLVALVTGLYNVICVEAWQTVKSQKKFGGAMLQQIFNYFIN